MTSAGSQCCSPNALKITTIIFSAFSLVVWGCSIGFIFGYALDNPYTYVASYVTIPANFGMIYAACRIIFLITFDAFPNEVTLHDLHQCVGRMLAFSSLCISTWVNSAIWLSQLPDYQPYIAFHCCNYGFVFGLLVTGLAGGLIKAGRRSSRDIETAAAYNETVVREPYQQTSQTHYNRAYSHGPKYYRD